MPMINWIKRKTREFKKQWIIRKETDKIGGEEIRRLNRLNRQLHISITKSSIILDLIISWKFGEIKAPTKDEYDAVNSVDANKKLTWEYLISLQKKYRNENI